MPNAVTHFLIAILIAGIIRNYIAKDKKNFPLSLVLTAGIAGLLPDIDIPAYWGLNILAGTAYYEVHRVYTHTLLFASVFVLLALVTTKIKLRKIKLNYFFWLISLGVVVHITLDWLLTGNISPLYPISSYTAPFSPLVYAFNQTLLPGLDAILLIVWITYIVIKNKIKDFI
jgi:membrane-bound metal-dependent hydrolase YbcI (DUF457 family)